MRFRITVQETILYCTVCTVDVHCSGLDDVYCVYNELEEVVGLRLLGRNSSTLLRGSLDRYVDRYIYIYIYI